MNLLLANIIIKELRSIRRENGCAGTFNDCQNCKLILERIRQLELVVNEFLIKTKEDFKDGQ